MTYHANLSFRLDNLTTTSLKTLTGEGQERSISGCSDRWTELFTWRTIKFFMHFFTNALLFRSSSLQLCRSFSTGKVIMDAGKRAAARYAVDNFVKVSSILLA